MSGWGPGYPHYVTCALSNKPKREGATRLRPEMVFSRGKGVVIPSLVWCTGHGANPWRSSPG